MIIDWLKFIPALLLLWLPAGLLHGKNTTFRPISREWTDQWPLILTFGLHWFDFVRAIAGAWLLHHSLTVVPDAKGLLRYAVPFAEVLVLTTGITLQAFFCKEHESIHAPYAWLSGMLFGYFSPITVILPIVVGITVAAGSSTAAAFFPMVAIFIPISLTLFAGFGPMFKGKVIVVPSGIGFCIAILPWLLSLLFSRDLVLAQRSRPKTKDSASELPAHR
jgi:hypothetical protein